MANPDSIVYDIGMSGAQEEDFETPIYVELTSEDGTYQREEVYITTTQLTFSGLSPGKEYLFTIRNDEKVFSRQSYFTPEEKETKGDIFAAMDGDQVSIRVENVQLKRGEFYTVAAKNEQGSTVFSKDGMDTEAVYSFSVSKPGILSCTLSINGTTYAACEVGSPAGAQYDFSSGAWSWSGDNSSASVSFAEKNGGDPLVLEATVTVGATVEPTCEEEGYILYRADAQYEGRTYSNEQKEEFAALGHSFGELIAEVPATCEEDGKAAYCQCSVCEKFFTPEQEETTEEALVLPAIGHAYAFDSFEWSGYSAQAKCVCANDPTHIEYHEATMTEEVTEEPACEQAGVYTYTASYEGNTESKNTAIAKLEHDYQFDSFVWNEPEYEHEYEQGYEQGYEPEYEYEDEYEYEYEGEYTAKAKYICQNDQTHIEYYDALVQSAVTTAPTCEGTGIRTYTATYGEYSDTKDKTLSALGHDYQFDSFVWNGFTAQAKYICTHDHAHVLYYDAEISDEVTTAPTCEGQGKKIYTASYDGHTDTKEETLDPIGHKYGEPEFTWTASNNGYAVTATFTCINNQSHVATVQAEKVERQENTPFAGYITYTATFTFNLATYSDQKIEEVVVAGEELSLNDGQLFISPSGYARSESGLSNPTSFVSSASNPYVIADQTITGCDNIIQVYQTDSNLAESNIYIKLSNVSLSAQSWASLFRIYAKNKVNIYLLIEGNVTFSGGSGQQIFSSQSYDSPTVNIIIDQTKGTFTANLTDGLTHAQTGTINVSYINN